MLKKIVCFLGRQRKGKEEGGGRQYTFIYLKVPLNHVLLFQKKIHNSKKKNNKNNSKTCQRVTQLT